MNIQDLLFKKKPLVVDGEEVEGAFIKPLPVSEMINLGSLGSEKDNTKTVNTMIGIINKSIVDKDGKPIFKTKDAYDADFMGKCINSIIEVNSTGGGK